MGVLLGLAALVATALLAKQATSRHWQRRQTAVVMDTLKDLKREDVERLLKAVRQGSQSAERTRRRSVVAAFAAIL
jgi:L-rhamnose isomerase